MREAPKPARHALEVLHVFLAEVLDHDSHGGSIIGDNAVDLEVHGQQPSVLSKERCARASQDQSWKR